MYGRFVTIENKSKLVFTKPGNPHKMSIDSNTGFAYKNYHCTKYKIILCTHYDMLKLFNTCRTYVTHPVQQTPHTNIAHSPSQFQLSKVRTYPSKPNK